MTGATLGFAEEQLLPTPLGLGGLLSIKLAQAAEFRRGRKIQQFLEFGHEVHLAAPVENIDPVWSKNS
jgi:hypothetical protein